MKNETVLFDTVTPHPLPVQISELLTDIEAVIKKHVILSDHAAAALAVWVLHTWTFELRDTVAYVAIESPEKRCGKTTLLSVLAAMACKPLIASNITVGALFRAIDTCQPALFIDEADTFLAGNSVMRGIINSGNTRRTAYVLRLSASRQNPHKPLKNNVAQPLTECPERAQDISPGSSAIEESATTPGSATQKPAADSGAARSAHIISGLPFLKVHIGDTFQSPPPEPPDPGLKKYSCWCPKVIAMIGEVPDTIADRSIVVKMSRKLVTETCAPLAELNTTEIKSKCARFALDCGPEIARARKIHGEGLNDRAADTFDPLYVIARLAGPQWEQRLHIAALTLAVTDDSEKSGSGLILDILDIFFDFNREKMFSRELVSLLRDGSLKSHALKTSSVNEHQIARVLRPYGIKPITMRIGEEVRNGYLARDFQEALNRYVSVADREARVDAIQQRTQLHIEAHEEAKKRQALTDKVRSRSPRTLEEAKAMYEEELKMPD